MTLIKLVDARRSLNLKCRELFRNEKIAESIYRFLCDGIEECEDFTPADVPDRKVGKWLEKEVIHAEEAKEVITEWQSCKCSVCGCYDTRPYLYCFNKPRFCSWCGADMRGEYDV